MSSSEIHVVVVDVGSLGQSQLHVGQLDQRHQFGPVGGRALNGLGLLWFENVSQALEEQLDGLGHLAGLLLQDHGRVLNLHPSALVGLEAPIEGHGGFHVRTVVARHVDDRHLEGPGRTEQRLAVGRDLAGDPQVGSLHVGVEEGREVLGVDLAGEMLLVDGHQAHSV